MTYRRAVDSIGERYGRLTVLSVARVGQHTEALCKCECGGTKTQRLNSLRTGLVKSCGCLLKESTGRPPEHGQSKSRTYVSWSALRQRCTNPADKDWDNYGGRGITVCERWSKFENFVEDMGERPEGMTMDRYPDNDGNYEPGNCRWATPTQQANNKRNSLRAESDM